LLHNCWLFLLILAAESLTHLKSRPVLTSYVILILQPFYSFTWVEGNQTQFMRFYLLLSLLVNNDDHYNRRESHKFRHKWVCHAHENWLCVIYSLALLNSTLFFFTFLKLILWNNMERFRIVIVCFWFDSS
jgi:hypothetical protein